MSKVLARCVPLPKLSRFGWLMGLYAENHARLQRLFEPADLACGGYVSSIGDGLDLRIDVLARHAYTVELRMSYGLVDPQTGLFDPSANLRLYNDARQVEATHCYAGRRWQPCGPASGQAFALWSPSRWRFTGSPSRRSLTSRRCGKRRS